MGHGHAHAHRPPDAALLRSPAGISAAVALEESIRDLVVPGGLSHLWPLAAAGVVGLGFVGNEVAALVRLRAGRRLEKLAWGASETVR